MDPSDETPDETSAPDPAAPARPRRRRLDGRTLGICVCVALVAAIVAALLAGALTGDDQSDASPGSSGGMHLIDTAALLKVPMVAVDGSDTDLAAFAGEKPILVNLWASSCAPCIKEMPLLEQARADNPALDFLGVDVLDRLDLAKTMVARTGVTYPWVQDPAGDFGNALKSTTLPSTFILDPDGTIVASKGKAFKSQAELQAWIDANT
ncbi:hypothetical protein BH10ACT1_BH10ACT1_40210 [soil metagenome]